MQNATVTMSLEAYENMTKEIRYLGSKYQLLAEQIAGAVIVDYNQETKWEMVVTEALLGRLTRILNFLAAEKTIEKFNGLREAR